MNGYRGFRSVLGSSVVCCVSDGDLRTLRKREMPGLGTKDPLDSSSQVSG